MAAWFHGGKGLNVAAGSATNDQACDYIAGSVDLRAKTASASGARESNSRHTSSFPVKRPTSLTRFGPLSDTTYASTRQIQIVYHCRPMHNYWRKQFDNERSFLFFQLKIHLFPLMARWKIARGEFELKI